MRIVQMTVLKIPTKYFAEVSLLNDFMSCHKLIVQLINSLINDANKLRTSPIRVLKRVS
jgi:hypothetical protein